MVSLAQSKKGIEWRVLAEMVLVVVGTTLFIHLIVSESANADEKTSENLCMAFNALRFKAQLDTPIGTYNLAPRACKTIDKGDLPRRDYVSRAGNIKEGLKAEIRDMMAKCWSMWLEGNQQNMFDSRFYYLQNGCFICYIFSIDKAAGSISYDEFTASLNTPIYGIDSSDRCAAAGQGGKCIGSCDASSTYFSKETASDRCEEGTKCCIANDNRDECKNKGGKCLNGPEFPYTEYYGKWRCKSGACYIKKEHMASYFDYIQGTGGVSGGAGKILFLDNAGFNSGSKYAVSIISPGKKFDIGTLGNIFGAAIAGTLSAAAVYSGVLTVPALAIGGGTTYALIKRSALSGSINDINMIAVSKYDVVSKKCAVEAGVGEA